ncbi:MAG: DUF2905 domain-containing protein [Sedimentisphaerales bacterium]|nr:DUF2905 domain-containing protein [Sedimentisphaerales bacterium]MBN2843342.1 DUF2905 domain-containing protein [Sedimentisphaerales bacterium]
MGNFENSDIGKVLIGVGLMLILAGAAFIGISKLGIGHIPGDLKFGDDKFRVYIPLGSCILISLIMTLIMWFLKK